MKYLVSDDQIMVQALSWHFQLQTMYVCQKNVHNGMKYFYPVLVLTFLLSTAYCDDISTEYDGASSVTENDMSTNVDVHGKYDTKTTNSPLSKLNFGRNFFRTNDFVSEAVSTAFTSSLIKNYKIKTANEASTLSSNIAENYNTVIKYPMTRTAIQVDDNIPAIFTTSSEQTKKLEYEHSSKTPTTARFLPTTPIPFDACDTDQVEVTNSAILVNAFTKDTDCNLLVTAPEDTSILVKLLNSSLSDATTYFYVNRSGSLPEDCPDRYVLVLVDFAPCITMIRGGQSKFYFQNTKITIELRTVRVQMPPCSLMQINALEGLQCNSTSYAAKVNIKTETFAFTWLHDTWRSLRVIVVHYLARCTCDCTDNCMCILGYREWFSMCSDGKDSITTHANFIVYKQTILGLSFANTGMNEIQQHALSGLESLEVLILEHNSLSILPATICQSLPQLKVLKLGFNILSNLTADLFKGRCELKLLGIYLNDNKLTFVAPELFNSTTNLEYLDLRQNRLVHISNDTFRRLKRLYSLNLDGNHISYLEVGVFNSQTRLVKLDLSDNVISHIQSDVFDSLKNLRALDLSVNHISVLPVDVFDSMRFLNVLDLSHNYISVLTVRLFYSLGYLRTLDLSDNHILELPVNVFYFLTELITLDLSSNYISVLPMSVLMGYGVFDLVGKYARKGYEFRSLDLHDNNISTLHVNVFKSLWGLQTLDVSHNGIQDLPSDVFKALTRLQTLDLSHNAIEVIPSELLTPHENLLTLDLSSNNIPTLLANVFKSLGQLYVLDMSHNVLHDIPSDVFQSLTKLKTLDLSHNTIEVIPSELLISLGNLLIIDLSRNSLSMLQPGSFLALKNLITLNLCCNNLTSIATETLETLAALQVLDLSKNRITKFLEPLFSSTINLLSLEVSGNDLKSIPFQCFGNLSMLTYLNLSKNSLTSLPSFNAQRQLQVLDLSKNKLVRLITATFNNLGNLVFLSLHKNELITLSGRIFYQLNSLLFLNASYNAIQTIEPMVFNRKNKLQTLDMRGNSMSKVTHNSFTDPRNATIIVDEYATCCFMDEAQCVALNSRTEYLTCSRMLRAVFLRISVWMFGLSAFICNGIAYFVRSRKRQGDKVQTILISHLALSDLLMGVNMLILATADVYYGEYFPSYVDVWRHDFSCKLAGFLSIFSSEGSVFFIVLISIDRMLGIKYPFGGRRLTTTWARIGVALAWLTAFLISVIPIALATVEANVFSISEVCVGIPIVRQHLSTYRSESVQINVTFTKTTYKYNTQWYWLYKYTHVSGVGVEHQQSVRNISYDVADVTGSQIAPIFSIVVFIGVNLTCFFIVAFCYMYIFIKSNKTSEGTSRTLSRNEQVRMAKKMFAIVFTDFCCWVPLCFICILAQCGILAISPEMYAWTVGFILPINSSINPFLYVLYEAIIDYRKKKKEERDARNDIQMQVRWRPVIHFGLKFDQQ